MTYIDIDKAIVDIVKQKCAECKVRLDRVSKENPTERKALQLEYGMYTFCGNAGAMINGCDRRKVLEIRHRFLNGVISVAHVRDLCNCFADQITDLARAREITTGARGDVGCAIAGFKNLINCLNNSFALFCKIK